MTGPRKRVIVQPCMTGPKRLTLAPDGSNCRDIALTASETLSQGGVLLYPTETVYGLGCDAQRSDALLKLYYLKQRPPHKLPILIADSIKRMQSFVTFSEVATQLAQHVWPGPLSIVLSRAEHAPIDFWPQTDTIAFRISPHPFCQALTASFERPIVSTSANLSGQEVHIDVDAILGQFNDRAAMIDLIIDAGPLPPQQSSTLISCIHNEIEILREGAITLDTLQQIIG